MLKAEREKVMKEFVERNKDALLTAFKEQSKEMFKEQQEREEFGRRMVALMKKRKRVNKMATILNDEPISNDIDFNEKPRDIYDTLQITAQLYAKELMAHIYSPITEFQVEQIWLCGANAILTSSSKETVTMTISRAEYERLLEIEREYKGYDE